MCHTFWFWFCHSVYPYWLKEDLIVRLELDSPEKVVLCSGDPAATYKLSDISIEYDTIFGEQYYAFICVNTSLKSL